MPQKQEENMELPDISAVLEESEQIIKQCFKQFRTEEVFLSFNGGKDCTLLLDLTINVLRQIYKEHNVGKKLKVFYIRTRHPFREIEEFVEEIQSHYGITLRVEDGEMKTTLQKILDEDNKLKACLMGTRRTDPYSTDLKFMQKTDPSWPQVIRVFPLLNWTYHQIWSYIIQRKVPYCSLYDKGYTSIGSTHNTWPNPALAYKVGCGCISYLPAWRLTDVSMERAGRGVNPTAAVPNGHDSHENGLAGHENGLAGHENGHSGHENGHAGHKNGHCIHESNGDAL